MIAAEAVTVKTSNDTAKRRAELDQIEAKIEQQIEAHRKCSQIVGEQFAVIRQKRLYKLTHKTFDGYMLARWPNISRATLYRAGQDAAVRKQIPKDEQAKYSASARRALGKPSEAVKNHEIVKAAYSTAKEYSADMVRQALQGAMDNVVWNAGIDLDAIAEPPRDRRPRITVRLTAGAADIEQFKRLLKQQKATVKKDKALFCFQINVGHPDLCDTLAAIARAFISINPNKFRMTVA